MPRTREVRRSSAAMILWCVPHVLWCLHGTLISPRAVLVAAGRPLVAGTVAAAVTMVAGLYLGKSGADFWKLLIGGGTLRHLYLGAVVSDGTENVLLPPLPGADLCEVINGESGRSSDGALSRTHRAGRTASVGRTDLLPRDRWGPPCQFNTLPSRLRLAATRFT